MPEKKPYFLVVDDSSTMRKVIRGLLRAAGYANIVEANDGASAWKLLEITALPIDFVITDWDMPEMDGLSFLNKIRGASKRKSLPVLMTTAKTTKEKIVQAMTSGANGYIVKPFNARTLVTKIESVFAQRGEAGGVLYQALHLK